MDDSKYGIRNKRGDWRPTLPITYPPLFAWPVKPIATAKWLFRYDGYILPWSLFYALVAVGIWSFLTPSFETITSGNYWWIGYLLVRNALLVTLVYGAWHLALYIRRTQGAQFKYNATWPSNDNRAFLLGRQNADNLIWTFASGVPIWTAYESVMLWLFASGRIAFVSWSAHPVYCVVLMLLVPLIHDVHFYCVHRLLHWPPLYRMVHSYHHNNVNPGPWSGLAMHPVEHALYFSGALIYAIIPAHPIHALFHLLSVGLGPAQSHAGFDKVVLGDTLGVNTHGFQHYLHHKYFECNYSDGAIPLDKWFGTFHDGSPEAQSAMDNRFRARMARANAPK